MKDNGFRVLTLSSSGPEVEEIILKEGVAHMEVPLTRTITPWQDLRSLWEMVKLFKKIKPDVVHTHTPKAGLIGMWAANWAGVKVKLHTVAGIPWMESTGGKRLLLKQMEKLTYRFADQIMPNSKGLSEFIKRNRLTSDNKIKILGNGSSNGIDLEYFKTSEDLTNIAVEIRRNLTIKDGFVYVFVGRIVKDKGINELIEAFQRVLVEDQNVHLLLVGPFEDHLDPVSEHIRKVIEENTHIYTVGFQSDVRPWLLASDVLVFPSYREGFPNVPMQAGALGLPIIATDINGCNEIIEEGSNGLLVPPKDENALHRAMINLKEDRGLRNGLKSNARPMIESRFDQKRIWEQLLEEYKNQLKLPQPTKG